MVMIDQQHPRWYERRRQEPSLTGEMKAGGSGQHVEPDAPTTAMSAETKQGRPNNRRARGGDQKRRENAATQATVGLSDSATYWLQRSL